MFLEFISYSFSISESSISPQGLLRFLEFGFCHLYAESPSTSYSLQLIVRHLSVYSVFSRSLYDAVSVLSVCLCRRIEM
jgi:hypothetical protein